MDFFLLALQKDQHETHSNWTTVARFEVIIIYFTLAWMNINCNYLKVTKYHSSNKNNILPLKNEQLTLHIMGSSIIAIKMDTECDTVMK